MDQVLNFLRTNPYAPAVLSLLYVVSAGAISSQLSHIVSHTGFKLAILATVVLLLKDQSTAVATGLAVLFIVLMMVHGHGQGHGQGHGHGHGHSVSPDDGELHQYTSTVPPPAHAFGPETQAPTGPIETATWGVNGPVSHVHLRGYDYAMKHETNLLPGGHGDGPYGDGPVGVSD